ncbi:MAG: hypothetical protein ACRDBY_15100 [Cetobacterium sp.]
MKNKVLALTLLLGLIMGGCSSSTAQLRDAQTSEILMLQDVKKQILLREAKTTKDLAKKNADLQIVNRQIDKALEVQAKAQATQNAQTNNAIKSVVTGAAAVGGAVWGIHELTK